MFSLNIFTIEIYKISYLILCWKEMVILDQQIFFEYVTIFADKLHICLIHQNKSDFSTFKT